MFYKKIIGTFTLLIFSVGILFSAYSFVSAYTNPQNNLKFDGIVTGKSSSSITFITADSKTIQLHIDQDTAFVDRLTFNEINIGDRLKSDARESDSEIIAKVIKRISQGSGYGHAD